MPKLGLHTVDYTEVKIGIKKKLVYELDYRNEKAPNPNLEDAKNTHARKPDPHT